MHDLLSFIEHLHLLLRVAVVGKHVDLRNHVIGKLIGKLLHRRLLAALKLPVLCHELVHSGSAGTRSGLIGGHMHAGDGAQVVDRFQCHHHLDGSAVGIGDDAARRVESVVTVHLRHHQRHVGVHAEGTRIVDHQRPVLRDCRSIFLRHRSAGRCECDIYILEIVAVLQLLNRVRLAAEYVCAAGTALRPEKCKLINGEILFLKHSDKFLSDSATGTNYSYVHRQLSVKL